MYVCVPVLSQDEENLYINFYLDISLLICYAFIYLFSCRLERGFLTYLLLDHIEELQKYWCMILWYISFKLVPFNISAGKWGSSTSWYSEISLIIHELTLTLYIMIFQMSLYIFY